jgi:glutamate synthase domain-containing protein 2
VKAATKGVIKVMSKMGISAIQSYRGAQVFEALGLKQDVIDHYFTGTASRVGGIGLDVIAQEVLMRHHDAFPSRQVNGHVLPSGGQYQWRKDGEQHLFTPGVDPQAPEGGPHRQLQGLPGVLGDRQRPGGQRLHAARPARLQALERRSRSRRSSRSRPS